MRYDEVFELEEINHEFSTSGRFILWRLERSAAGLIEVDLVAHAGTSIAGSFVHTMVLTNIATSPAEWVPAVVRKGKLVIETLGPAMTSFSFLLRTVDRQRQRVHEQAGIDWCVGRIDWCVGRKD